MHRFDSEAMNTNIDVLICGVEYNYARSAAIDAFADHLAAFRKAIAEDDDSLADLMR